MSIHPYHASRIYSLAKPYEFRRVGAGLQPGVRIFIYETAPVSLVTGEVVVVATQGGDAHDLVALEPDLKERDHVRRYLTGASRPVALQLGRAIRYNRGLSLQDLGVTRAPQSYQFLEK